MAQKTSSSKLFYYLVLVVIFIGIGAYFYLNYLQTKSKAAGGFSTSAAMACYKKNSNNQCPLSNYGNDMTPQELQQFTKSLTISECRFCLVGCFLDANSTVECKIKK